MKQCASCGSMLADDTKFCPKCGAPAESALQVPQQPAAGAGYVQPGQGAAPQNMPPYGYGAPVPAQAPQKPMNGIGLAGMIFGIFTYIFCWVPVFGLILGLVGVILSGVGLGRRERCSLNGFAIAGLVLSILGLVVALIMTIVVLAALGASGV